MADRVVEVASKHGWEVEHASGTRIQGLLAADAGRLSEARMHFEEAAAIYEKNGSEHRAGDVEADRAWISVRSGQFERALGEFDRFERTIERIGSEAYRPLILAHRAGVPAQMERAGEAREVAERALELAAADSNLRAEARAWWSLAEVAMSQDAFEEAVRHYDEATRLLERCGSNQQCIVALEGWLADLESNPDGSHREKLDALDEQLRHHQFAARIPEMLMARALLEARGGDLDAAATYVDEATQRLEDVEEVNQNQRRLAERVATAAEADGRHDLAERARALICT